MRSHCSRKPLAQLATSPFSGVSRTKRASAYQWTGGVRPNASENDQISPQSPFELPEMRAVVRATRLSCQNAGKAQKLCRLGIHLENLV